MSTEIIPEHPGSEIATEIFKHYRSQRDEDRAHLGGSVIGAECARRVWYAFRWAYTDKFGDGSEEDEGRVLRLFQRGHREEAFFISDLRAIGLEVHEHDPQTGKQWQFSDCGGHFGGSLDGVIRKLGKREWVMLECKTSNEKGFIDLQLRGMRDAKPQHFAQVQTYMKLSGLRSALYVVVNKNNDALYSEIVEYDPATGERMLMRAKNIIFAPEPPEPISRDPAFFKCKWCPARSICFGPELPRVNARTCAHSTPMPDGTWHCERCNRTLTLDEQRDDTCACGDNHVYIPAMIAHRYEYLGSDDGVTVKLRDKKTGRELVNGPPPHVTSKELRALAAGAMDDTIQLVRESFDARVVEDKPIPGTVAIDAAKLIELADLEKFWKLPNKDKMSVLPKDWKA